MYKYDEFSLHIREDGKIEAEFSPSQGTHERLEGQLTLSDKLRPFIENSIQRLRDAKLDEKELELLGESLYEALFPDSIGRDFTRYWRAVRKDREKRLRVSLSMEAGSEVVTWPLEFLRGPLGWLSTDSDLTLSRRIVFEEEHWDMVPDEPPLKVLVIVSQPNKMGGVMSAKVIEAIADWAQLEEKGAEPGDESISGRAAGPSTMTLRKPKVEVQLLGMMEGFEKIKIPGIEYLKRPASFTEFRSYSSNRDWRPQVIHFIGHGKFVRNEASLAMVDNGNDVDWIEASSFANAISEINPRLVVLQACQSARPGTSPTLLSLAALLVQNMIPAVVAMQFSIRNDYATLFSSEFYRALALGEDIDAAVQRGRWKIPNDPEKKVRWKERHFGAPVLYMLHPDGIIRPVSSVAQQRSLSVASGMPDVSQPLGGDREPAGGMDDFSYYLDQAKIFKRKGDEETARFLMKKAQDLLAK